MMAAATAARRVLVLDDDEPQARLYADMLSAAGYEASAVPGVAEAFIAVDASPADVIVTDICLPGMNGLEFVKRVRARGRRPEIVVMSGFNDSGQVVEALRLGAFLHLDKPVSRRVLVDAVERAMRRERSADRITVAGDAEGWTEITAPSHREYIGRLEHFLAKLLRTSMPAAAVADLEVALREMLANAIEWGNRESVDRPVHVAWKLEPGRVLLRIEDHGDGFDLRAVLAPEADPLAQAERREAQGLRPGGYGLHLTRTLMDDVAFNAAGNRVTLTKRLPSGVAAPNGAGA